MSLIYTCELSGENPFECLTVIQKHARELAANPGEWMPWTYRETLARLGARGGALRGGDAPHPRPGEGA